MTTMPRPVVLVDRDGTVLADPQPGQAGGAEGIALVPGAVPGLMHLQAAGFDLVMLAPEGDTGTTHQVLLQVLESCHVSLRDVVRVPDLTSGSASTSLLTDLLKDRAVDWERSSVVGARHSDMELAQALGITGYQLGPVGDWDWGALTHDLIDRPRTAEVSRVMPTTQVDAFVDLDAETGRVGMSGESAGGWGGSGVAVGDAEGPLVSTGVGMLDRMLQLLAEHSGIYLELRAVGDLHIDAHFTVQDTGIALGEAISSALGTRRRLGRFGFTTPLDDALATAALDLSGYPYLDFEGTFPAEMVGDLPTEMIPHFWRSFCDGARLTLHLTVTGDNAHHMAAATATAVGRALRQAVARTVPGPAVEELG